jgi:hypothetical protein
LQAVSQNKCRESNGKQSRQPDAIRHYGLLLQQPDSGGKCQYENAHPALCPRREPGTVSP